MTPKQAYDLLEIDEDTQMNGVKHSFRRAAKLYHPDTASGLGNTDKFHLVTTAYKIIIKERKQRAEPLVKNSFPNGTGKKFNITLPDFAFLSLWKQTEKKSRKKRGESVGKSFTALGLLTYDELLIRFDMAPSDWAKIEAAHTVYSRFNEKFESFAIPRLSAKTPVPVLAELIDILGRMDSESSFEAIARYLSNKNRKICCAAFMALDRAGGYGHKMIDKRLGTKSAFSYFVDGFFHRSNLERHALKTRVVSRLKMRRLIAVMRKTGLPLRELLDEMGVIIPQTTSKL